MPKFPESLASVERVHIAIWNAASPKNKKEKVMTNLKPEERAREWIDRKLEEVGWKVINRDEYAPGMTAVAVREVAILKTVESTLSQIRRRRARGTSGLWPSSP